MTSSKNTKRALLASVLSVLLCVAMLLGSTWAWFTDTVTSGNNKIVAGNLDVELEYLNKDNQWKKVEKDTELFSALEDDGETANLWEPGHTEVVYLKVSNIGSLALKYQLAVNVASETAFENALGEKDCHLSDYLVFGKVESNTEIPKYDTREDAWAAAGDTLGLSDYTKEAVLYPAEAADDLSEQYIALVVYMPTTVGNEANYRGEVIPSIDLGVSLVATQTPYEADSFNDQYDKDAKYPVVDAESLKTTLVDGGVINLGASFNMMNENTVAGRNQINADTVLNLNNETLTFRNAATDDDPTNISAIYAENFDLTLNAENGGIDSDFYGINVGDASNAAAVQPTVTINGGTYKAGSVVNVESGTVYITGGFFDGRDVYGDGVNATYLLNCIDRCYKAGNAKIVVTGGTFVNFNPANNSAEGAGTNFVPEGYTVQTTADGANTLYTVVA